MLLLEDVVGTQQQGIAVACTQDIALVQHEGVALVSAQDIVVVFKNQDVLPTQRTHVHMCVHK